MIKRIVIDLQDDSTMKSLRRDILESQCCWSIIEMLGRQTPVPEDVLEKYKTKWTELQISAEELRQDILFSNLESKLNIKQFTVDAQNLKLIIWYFVNEDGEY